MSRIVHRIQNTGLAIGLVLALPLPAGAEAFGEPIVAEGIVELRGSQPNKSVFIRTGAGEALLLCDHKLTRRVGEVSGMTVAVSAKMATTGRSKKPCAAPESLRVLKTGSGNIVLTGRLERRDSGLFLANDGGATRIAAPVPAGLSGKIGQEIMLVTGAKSRANLTTDRIDAVSFLQFATTLKEDMQP